MTAKFCRKCNRGFQTKKKSDAHCPKCREEIKKAEEKQAASKKDVPQITLYEGHPSLKKSKEE